MCVRKILERYKEHVVRKYKECRDSTLLDSGYFSLLGNLRVGESFSRRKQIMLFVQLDYHKGEKGGRQRESVNMNAKMANEQVNFDDNLTQEVNVCIERARVGESDVLQYNFGQKLRICHAYHSE